MSNLNNESILDTILDGTLDDLADLPERKPFPAGTHVAKMKLETKEINDKPAVVATFTLVETREMANTEEAPPEAGMEAQVAYILIKKDGTSNDVSQGLLKKLLALAPEEPTNREKIKALNGATVLMSTSVRPAKDGYAAQMNINEIALV